MSNELATTVTDEVLAEYMQAFGLAKSLQPNEVLQFIGLAKNQQLNPFKREIYCVAYGSGEYRTCSIITGYEVYLKRAERTGKLDGWKCWIDGEGPNMTATVEIYRKDWSHPFQHTALFSESVQKKKDGTVTAFWTKQPKFQLKKVCISQGFRLCFPDELGSLPYTEGEADGDLPDRDITDEATATTAAPTEPPPPPADPWVKEWNTRTNAIAKKVAKWPKPDRDAMKLGELVKTSQERPELMDLAEARAEIYASMKDSPMILMVVADIVNAGEDLEATKALAGKAYAAPEEDQLF